MKLYEVPVWAAVLALCLLTGCDRTAAPGSLSEPLPSESETAQETAAVTGEMTPVNRILGEHEDVAYLGYLSPSTQVDGKYITDVTFYDTLDDRLILSYGRSDRMCTPIEDFEGEGMWDQERYLTAFDPETGTLGRTLAQPVDSFDETCNRYTYVEVGRSLVWMREQSAEPESGRETLNATGYNGDLRAEKKLVVEDGTGTYGWLDPQGDWYYMVENSMICRLRQEGSGLHREYVALEQTYAVSGISAVFASGGHTYVWADGMAGDLRNYQAVIDADSGSILYMTEDLSVYPVVDKGYLTLTDYGDGQERITVFGDEGAFVITQQTGEEWYISREILADGRVLLNWTDGGGAVRLVLLNADGTVRSSTAFIPESPEGDHAVGWFSTVSACGEDTLYFNVLTDGGDTLFFRWDVPETGELPELFTVTPFEEPEVRKPEIDDGWNPYDLVPGEVPAELSGLRERADRLEETYGIKLYISDQCKNCMGGYAVLAVNDFTAVQDSLNILEQELARYPDGFFTQFKDDWTDGIAIYLAGVLKGINPSMPEFAGGFQCQENGMLNIVIDTTDSYTIANTLHHEMCHAIEDKLVWEENSGFSEEVWQGLNPSECGDLYSYSYLDACDPAAEAYIYGWNGEENAYFVDEYALTFPTEDRARLFENAMAGDGWVDWDSAPHLRAKLEYWSACIEAGFDTEGWDSVPWEAVLTQ